MRTSQPQNIYLSDYRAPAFLVDQVDLHVALFSDGARVRSTLAIRHNPESAAPSAPLELDGDAAMLTLETLRLNGATLPAEDYTLGAESLVIAGVPAEFELEVTTWLEPARNTRLEGLYQSSGIFCTQCEAEGFRCITYYPDRPDVMARFRTTIEADRAACPVLLSNGNPVAQGESGEGRHFVTWEDPFPKPSYLFALVAGDLVEIADQFTTASGRNVALKIYVESRNRNKCEHAMASLKRAMRWDEDVYGREYDLDIFMIVAVDDFNMGAMENKGLNIFNSSCVLASEETATDSAFQTIEAIVAHEYFHNWSGNRVTCRDWFQLSLKEGFTVFRDAQFSSDMGSPTVKRIEDATLMRTAQFAEDAGPMAHPVRPESYMEISNFYTLTIYEKGAEVVRMIHRLLGEADFRKGSDLYFQRHDGQAVTTDDFVRAMEDASGRDLEQFRRWYEQAGTPVLSVSDDFDAHRGIYTLIVEQSIPPTPGQPEKLPHHIPFSLGLLDSQGEAMPLNLSADELQGPSERVLQLTEPVHRFEFHRLDERPVPSLLRGFSAPVKVHYPWTREQLMFLVSHDSDGFNRWDAGQRLAVDVILSMVGVDPSVPVEPLLVSAYRQLLSDQSLDQALVAKMLQLPSEAYLIELSDEADVQGICSARSRVLNQLALLLRDELLSCYQRNHDAGPYELTPQAIARRSLRNSSLAWLLQVDDEEGRGLALKQYHSATTMTDRLGALRAIVNSGFERDRQDLLADFYQQWQADPQVLEQWFSVQAASARASALPEVESLLAHPAFDWKNPNKIRCVLGAFAGQNYRHFHAEDGSGYRFLAEHILHLDSSNPQIAARLVQPLTRWRTYAPVYRDAMRSALAGLQAKEDLSRDVYEIVHKSLAG